MTLPETIKTKVNYYHFDITNDEEKAEYQKLEQELKSRGFRKSCHMGAFNELRRFSQIEFVDIETKILFNSQYNTGPITDSKGDWTDTAKESGIRVFDWSELHSDNRNMKAGYYLDLPNELIEAKKLQKVCGYCGNRSIEEGDFCLECIGSEYLTKSQLHLLRMVPVAEDTTTYRRAPLTEGEERWLLPYYQKSQEHAKKVRAANQRLQLEADCNKAIANATSEYQGKIWLLDNGLSLNNVIYYSFKDTWCFGYKKPVTNEEKSKILEVISEFPFAYEIKLEDGRKLEGY